MPRIQPLFRAAVLSGVLGCIQSSAWAQVGLDSAPAPLLNEWVTRKEVPPPRVEVRSVDHYGKVQNWTARVSARWNWLSRSIRSEKGQPAVEIRWESKPGMTRGMPDRDKEFKPTRFNGLEIWASTGGSESLRLGLNTDRILTQAVGESAALFFTLKPVATYVDIEEECTELGIRFTRIARYPQALLYFAARCERVSGGGMRVMLYIPSDSAVKLSPELVRQAKLGGGWIQLLFTREQMVLRTTRTPLGSIQIAGSESLVTIYRDRPKVSKGLSLFRGWTGSVGIGPSLLFYHELPDNERLTILGITGKIAGQTQLIPERLDLGLNAFGTLLPIGLSTTPADLEPKRFFGVNARLGYNFPGDPKALRWALNLGWYFWGMFGSDPRYGINLLSGPQIYVVGRKALAAGRSVYGYFKFAPITDSFANLTLQNRELAGGCGYFWMMGRRSVGVTLDIASMNFAVLGAQNVISLGSYSLGMSLSL